jgi:hypothetical protein
VGRYRVASVEFVGLRPTKSTLDGLTLWRRRQHGHPAHDAEVIDGDGRRARVRSVSEVEAMPVGSPRPAEADDVAELRVVETWLATGEAAVMEIAGEGEREHRRLRRGCS